MSIFTKGANWEATRIADLEKGRSRDRAIMIAMAICIVTLAIALAMLTPLRRTAPYLVQRDAHGNYEVLRAFDNRAIGNQELLNKHWARRYVTAREQYNWWLVADDYDTVASLTDPTIFKEYSDQFNGDKGLDKVFGDFTERRIKILSIAPSPTNAQQMVVRFERTTMSKGVEVEAPTVFVANMTFRYNPNTYASEQELIRNPMGFQVYSYRRDVEVSGTAVPRTDNTVGMQLAGQGGQ